MPVPDITHLQFLVLETIGGSDRSGRFVRERLAKEGVRRSLPAFYQMMGRLEDAKLVSAQTRRAEVEGHAVSERWYKLTGSGIKAWEVTRDFYAERALGKTVAQGGLQHG